MEDNKKKTSLPPRFEVSYDEGESHHSAQTRCYHSAKVIPVELADYEELSGSFTLKIER